MSVRRRLAGALGATMLLIGVPTAALAHQPLETPTIQQEGQGTYENMITALDNLGAEVAQLNTMTEMTVTNVRIFDAAYLASGQDPTAFEQAVALHDPEIQDVRNTLANHQIVRTVLDEVQIPVESIVAVDALGAGDVAIYYRP